MTTRYGLSGLVLIGLVAAANPLLGQGLVNQDAKISVSPGTFLIVKGGEFKNDGAAGAVSNAGVIEVDGNWTNNSTTNVFGATPAGTVRLNGGAQTIGGSQPTNFYDLVVEGAASTKALAVNTNVHNVLDIANNIKVGLNSNTLTLENSNTNAITVAGNGGIIAETDPLTGYGIVKWGIGNTSTGSYTVPFATVAGGSIPLSYNIVSAGNMTGGSSPYKQFSTYPTGLDNMPLDLTVNHLTDDYGNDNSSKVYDRFWLVQNDAQGNYGPDPITDYPDVRLTFTYLDAELSGTIVESQLVAQRYNDQTDRWGDWLYSPVANTGSNTVEVNLTRVEDYFPIWTLVDNSDPLPIELARFVGQCQDGDVLISWTTFTETNNDFFTLERSKNGVDFEVVEVIAAAGNSNSPITYQVLDQQSLSGTSYYRLKNTDFFGKEEYSQVIAVTCGSELTDFTFVNAYDVDHQDVVVEFTAAANEFFTITLFDASGRLIVSNSGRAIENGMNKVKVSVGELSHGIYIVNLQNESKRFSKKVSLK